MPSPALLALENETFMRHFVWLAALAALLLTACADVQGTGLESTELEAGLAGDTLVTQTSDVFGQGPLGPVVAADGATVLRTPNGISTSLSMPTPEPGTYTYPTEGEAFSGPGRPEVFTLWVFVFDLDQPPFDPEEGVFWTGVFAAAGHTVGGPNLTFNAHVSKNSEPLAGEKLVSPDKAEVHLAVAPHGALDAEMMPEQIQTPTGPGPDIWWLALFDPPG
jgi:hypothetical protein